MSASPLKIRMCSCELSALVRPRGPIEIKKTEIVTPDLMVAKLGGCVKGDVSVVRVKPREYYFVKPKSLGGGAERVPADSLTDCLNYTIRQINRQLEKGKAFRKEARGGKTHHIGPEIFEDRKIKVRKGGKLV